MTAILKAAVTAGVARAIASGAAAEALGVATALLIGGQNRNH